MEVDSGDDIDQIGQILGDFRGRLLPPWHQAAGAWPSRESKIRMQRLQNLQEMAGELWSCLILKIFTGRQVSFGRALF